MSDVSASAVASLRARTGVSMMECQKALTESKGDEEKAIDILRSKGEASAVKKAGREQGEGYIFSKSDDGKVAIILLKCETDFVSRGDDFQAFGNELAELAFTEGEDAVRSAEDKINEAVQKMGENITLGDVNVVEGETIGCYVHTNGKIGVVVTLKGGSAELARDVAMHAAAMNPSYISPEDVPADDVKREAVIWKEQLKSEGKP